MIVIARGLGKTIELNSGLNADDRVIENPSDGIADCDQVNVAENTTKADKNKNDKKVKLSKRQLTKFDAVQLWQFLRQRFRDGKICRDNAQQ